MLATLPPKLPANAPFNPVQRAWVDGYLAGLLSLEEPANGVSASVEAQVNEVAVATEADDSAPWHDPALEIDERMALAEGRPLRRKMMAAMGQLDCGQCGYDCQTYAEAIASGAEAKLNRCVPGGKTTQRMLKKLMTDAVPVDAVAESQPSVDVCPASVVAKFGEARRLHPEGAEKDTRHVVIDLKDTGLTYEPGDSLGVVAMNDPVLVRRIIEALGAAQSDQVGDGNGHSRTLEDALIEDRDLRTPTEDTFRLLAECATDKDEAVRLRLLAEDEDPDGDLDELDLLDVLERYPSARPPAKALVETLDELQSRLYSISSSPRAHPGEVHLTVGVTRTLMRDRIRNGVASTYFAERIAAGAPLKVYRQPAHAFALPADDEKPVIMIGPGTGIAPFRAFLEERCARNAAGRNWLFFGNPHGGSDYLYRDELEGYAANGLLTRLDTAFSRDQAEKIYVQDRMRENAEELWRWLQDGAHVYVCGDAKRMASDVDKALQEVAASHGIDGKAFVTDLAKAGRYQRDVY